MIDVALLVRDRDLPAADGLTFERLNPITGEVAARAAAASVEDAQEAAAAAAAAFPVWSTLGPNQRRARLSAAADELERRGRDFVAAMADETGATDEWGRFNVALAAAMLREAAALTTLVAGEIVPSDRAGATAFALRQPVGVVLGIAPWNAPVILGVRAVAAPLACGNTVVLKGSEICPRTHRLVGERLPRRRVAAKAWSTSSATRRPTLRDIVEALIAHPTVRRVNFTGSTAGRPASWPSSRRATSSRRCSSSAARRRSSCSTTPTSTRRSPPRPSGPS